MADTTVLNARAELDVAEYMRNARSAIAITDKLSASIDALGQAKMPDFSGVSKQIRATARAIEKLNTSPLPDFSGLASQLTAAAQAAALLKSATAGVSKIKAPSVSAGAGASTGISAPSAGSFAGVTQQARDFDGVLSNVGSGFNPGVIVGKLGAVAAGFVSVGAAVGGIQSSIAAFGRLEQSTNAIAAITGLSGDAIEGLSVKVDGLSLKYNVLAADINDAVSAVGSQLPQLLGTPDKLLSVTESVLTLQKAAIATNDNITALDAARIAGQALNQFGADASEAARFVNVLAAGTKEGASAILQTSSALVNAGGTLSRANISFEESNALIQALSGLGEVGERAGTSLNQFATGLIKVGKIAGRDVNPQVVGLSQALRNLTAANLGETELKKIFNEEGARAAAILTDQLKKNIDSFDTLTGKITGTSEAMAQAATLAENQAEGQNSLAVASNRLAVAVGKELSPAYRELLSSVTDLLNYSADKLPKFIKAVGEASGLESIEAQIKAAKKLQEDTARGNVTFEDEAPAIRNAIEAAAKEQEKATQDALAKRTQAADAAAAVDKKSAEKEKLTRAQLAQAESELAAQSQAKTLRDIDERINLSKKEAASKQADLDRYAASFKASQDAITEYQKKQTENRISYENRIAEVRARGDKKEFSGGTERQKAESIAELERKIAFETEQAALKTGAIKGGAKGVKIEDAEASIARANALLEQRKALADEFGGVAKFSAGEEITALQRLAASQSIIDQQKIRSEQAKGQKTAAAIGKTAQDIGQEQTVIAELEKAKEIVDALAGKENKIKIDADITAAQAKVTELSAQLAQTLNTEIDNIPAFPKLTALLEQINAASASGGQLPGFDKGGIVPFTGIAALHGTPTRPESVLNARATGAIGADVINRWNAGDFTAGLPRMNVVNHFGGASGDKSPVNITIGGKEYTDTGLWAQARKAEKLRRLLG
jgi:TP901 family phage tail tape measure protein